MGLVISTGGIQLRLGQSGRRGQGGSEEVRLIDIGPIKTCVAVICSIEPVFSGGSFSRSIVKGGMSLVLLREQAHIGQRIHHLPLGKAAGPGMHGTEDNPVFDHAQQFFIGF